MMFAPPTRRPSCRPTPGSPGSILIERAVEAHTRPTVVDATQRTSPWAPKGSIQSGLATVRAGGRNGACHRTAA
jgi:hypothetical protein